MSPLRLMTYNVRYFGHGTRGVMSTPCGVRRIARVVASLEPLVDVLCLQEVEGRSLRTALVTWHPSRRRTQLQVLLAALDEALQLRGIRERYQALYFPAHAYHLIRGATLYTTGLAILVRERFRIDAHNADQVADITYRRGARRTKRLKQTRICAHVALALGDRTTLDVFNTHMSLPGFLYPELWRRGRSFGYGPNQVREAQHLVDVIRHRSVGGHRVLVGDFNSLPDSPVDAILRQDAHLVDALAQAKGLSPRELRDWSTAGFMHMRMNIDRIYASPSLRWLDFRGSVPFDNQAHKKNPFAGLSDHVPLVGRFRVPSLQ